MTVVLIWVCIVVRVAVTVETALGRSLAPETPWTAPSIVLTS